MHLPHRSQGLFLRNLLWSFRNPHAEHPSAHRAAGHQNDADATPVQTRNRLAQGAYLGKVQGACFLPKQRTGAYFDHHGGLLRRRWEGGSGASRPQDARMGQKCRDFRGFSTIKNKSQARQRYRRDASARTSSPFFASSSSRSIVVWRARNAPAREARGDAQRRIRNECGNEHLTFSSRAPTS